MIKNVIFDYGNTLARYVPQEIIKFFGVSDKSDIEIIETVVFDRKLWDRLDDGTLSQEVFKTAALAGLPERLHEKTVEICDFWQRSLPAVNGMEALVKKLKTEGYKLYILSNISENFVKDKDKINIFKYFDGFVFSAEIRLTKPHKEIFEYILNKFSLEPNESVFIDDAEANVKAAADCGIKSMLFKGNADEAERFIYGMK